MGNLLLPGIPLTAKKMIHRVRNARGGAADRLQAILKMFLKPISLSGSKCDPQNIIYNGCLSRMSVRGGCASSLSANLAQIPIFEMAYNIFHAIGHISISK